MASSRELEHRAETDRNQIAETLNRLRERMSPGQLVDQAVEYARSNGGVDFARNLGNQAKANPIPVVIMAVGLGWLIFGRPPASRAYAPSIVPDDEFAAERSSLDERFDELARDRTAEVASAGRASMDTAAERTRRAWDRAREAGDYARESAEDAASRARDAAGRAGSHARDAASSAYDTAAGGAASRARSAMSSAYSAAAGAVFRTTDAVYGGAASISRHARDGGEVASEVGRSTARGARYAGRSIAEQAGHAQSTIGWLAREQPLVLGAIGLAIGALVGTGLPRTRREDEIMGETSDQLKDSARGQAREAGGRVADKVRGEAERQGFTTESAQEAIREIGEKVSAVAAAAREGTEDELKSAKEKADKGSEKHEGLEERPSGEGPSKTQAHEAAGIERYSEADPSYLSEGSGQPAGQDIKTTERVG